MRFDNPRAVQIRLRPFDKDLLVQVGHRVRDLYATGSNNEQRIHASCDDAYLSTLAARVTGSLGGNVGITPRLFLKKLVGEVLDRIDQYPDFDPRQHYSLTISSAELNEIERTALSVKRDRATIVTGFAQLHPAVQHHIVNSLEWRELHPLQEQSIEPILNGENVLLIAPTAGGKTEAAVFPILSALLSTPIAPPSVLYICPLRALLNNLELRLSYYARLLARSCALWHGDVTQTEKSRVLREPPDILLTTPESIEAILISKRVSAPAFFSRVRYIVLDELHAFASDDRGWHVWYLLKRLAALTEKPVQIVGLSATVGNPQEVLSWVCAHSSREQQVIAPEAAAPVEPDVAIDYVGSVENAAQVISLMHRGEKRLVFCDSRSQAEQLALHLRTREVETFVSHSSLSEDGRRRAESAFAESRNCVIVATSTLELGIDVGDLDRVIQINAPSTVASFLQRLGRTGRRTGTTRNCLFLATNSESLLRAAAIDHLWRKGWVEPVQPPPAPFHVAAQQALCLTLQNGFVSQKDLLGFVSQNALEHLLTKQFLVSDGPAIIIGPETERLYGKQNYLELLSVFDTPPLFLVEFNGREVGWIHELSLERRRDGSDPVILLGGRAWSVHSVNWERKTVSVEPSDIEGRSLCAARAHH